MQIQASHRLRTGMSRRSFGPELLESRTLLSAWGVVDDYQLASGKIAAGQNMASDAAGNVYAVGLANDSTGKSHGIVREKLAGSNTWSTIEDLAGPGANGAALLSIAVDGAGDVYVGGTTTDSSNRSQWVILEKHANSGVFSVVDSDTTNATFNAGVRTLAIDTAGNVFAAGGITVNSTKGKATTTNTWIVRKQTGGSGAFTTVDSAVSSNDTAKATTAFSATFIPSGASAGMYVVGASTTQWLVRKSSDAGTTWTTVDNFQYAAPTEFTIYSQAHGVIGDSSGHVYVCGFGTDSISQHSLVRESGNGGSSWTTADDFGLGGTPTMATGIGCDLAGNIYVGGSASDPSGTAHAIIRSNAGGSWTTVSDVAGKGLDCGFTIDPSGTLYAARDIKDSNNIFHWIVQSSQGPTAPGASLAMSALPSTAVAGAALSPAVTVGVKSALGAVVKTNNSKVTLSIASGPAGAHLGGTISVTAVKGIATFSNLKFTVAGSYTLKATDGTLKAAISKPITIRAAAAAKLVFASQPIAGTAGKILSPTITVKVEDIFGNVVINNSSIVALIIASGPIGGTLVGTPTAKAVKGAATFASLSLKKAGTYTLKAGDALLTAAVSKSIVVK